jgi:hypothetical protein
MNLQEFQTNRQKIRELIDLPPAGLRPQKRLVQQLWDAALGLGQRGICIFDERADTELFGFSVFAALRFLWVVTEFPQALSALRLGRPNGRQLVANVRILCEPLNANGLPFELRRGNELVFGKLRGFDHELLTVYWRWLVLVEVGRLVHDELPEQVKRAYASYGWNLLAESPSENFSKMYAARLLDDERTLQRWAKADRTISFSSRLELVDSFIDIQRQVLIERLDGIA